MSSLSHQGETHVLRIVSSGATYVSSATSGLAEVFAMVSGLVAAAPPVCHAHALVLNWHIPVYVLCPCGHTLCCGRRRTCVCCHCLGLVNKDDLNQPVDEQGAHSCDVVVLL
jgi:hypothetical protein